MSDPRKRIDKLAQGLSIDMVTYEGFVSELLYYCRLVPADRTDFLDAMSRHKSELVRHASAEVRRIVQRMDAQVKDVAVIRQTSPLQPGTRVRVFGGSDPHSQEFWLEG